MTEGDWRVEEQHIDGDDMQDIKVCRIFPEGPYRGDICRLQSAEHIGGIDAAEMLANARAIKALPKLVAAAQSVALIPKPHGWDSLTDEEITNIIESARDALMEAGVA